MRISDWCSDVCSSDLAVAVLALQERDRAAEITDVALDLGAKGNAPARHVIAGGVAQALRRAPDRLIDPVTPFALVLKRRVGVLKIARQRARAGGDRFEDAAFMPRQQLLKLAAELERKSTRLNYS